MSNRTTLRVDEISARPASWYASRPVPAKLMRDLTERFHASAGMLRKATRDEWRASGTFTRGPALTLVERAHGNDSRHLASDGWVCPKCGRVWSPSTDRCKACQP